MPSPTRRSTTPPRPLLSALAAIGATVLLGVAVQAAIPSPSPGLEHTTRGTNAAAAETAPIATVPVITPGPTFNPLTVWIEPPEELPTEAPASVAPASVAPSTQSGPSLPTHRVATRVAVPALGIDLPVIRQLTPYPPCRVAMYLRTLKQPGEGGVTYLYAHAQAGMFLPLLKESLVNNGRRMLGMSVIVWTGDNQRFTYRIGEVRRHITTLTGAVRWRGESAFLQTSEGRGIPQKLQVVATYVSVAETDYDSAHPVPRPRTC